MSPGTRASPPCSRCTSPPSRGSFEAKIRESNQLGQELSRFVLEYRAGMMSDVQFQARQDAWLAKLGTYQQKVLAYKPPAVTYRPQGHQSGAEIEDEAAARSKREGRWAAKRR